MRSYHIIFSIIAVIALLMVGCSKDHSTSPVTSENLQFDGTTITPNPPPPYFGCTLTPGFWKTHPEEWPQDEEGEIITRIFYSSSQNYFKVLWTEPKGNAYYILAHQAIAAYLNALHGTSVPTEAFGALVEANDLFNTYDPEFIATLSGKSEIRRNFVQLSELLDNYNNGLIGPGHCDD